MKNVPGVMPIVEDVVMSETNLKLRASPHYMRSHSAEQYCIRNAFGVICGGKAKTFIRFDRMNGVDFPTSFHLDEVNNFLIVNIKSANDEVNLALEDEVIRRDTEQRARS